MLRGGAGLDEVTYVNRALPVRVTPDGIADDGSAGESDRVDADVEVIGGGAGDDVLFAAAAPARLLSGDLGADTLTGAARTGRPARRNADAAADTLIGAGRRRRSAAAAATTASRAAPVRDVLGGDDGEDRLRGGTGRRHACGRDRSDRLEGGAGADCLHGF